ncbi:MAG: hypothetical protein H0U74_12345 [Bradymonadaceae bacterium]|nr:hypothetical protein [Lujinxingiaceae bacterium]
MTRDEMILIIRELQEGQAPERDIDAMVGRVEQATGYPDILELLEDEDEFSPEEIVELIFGYSEREA